MKFHRFVAMIAGLFIILVIKSVSAQSFVMQPGAKEKATIGLRFMHPNFSEETGLSTFSGAYDLYVNIPIGARLNFVGSLPFNAFSAEDLDGVSTIGDIYLGIQTRSTSASSRTNGSIGVFLPTASEEKLLPAFLGLTANFYEFQRSLPNVLTIYTNLAYNSRQSNAPIFGFEFGPLLSIPTEHDGDAEFFAHYGVSGGFQFTNVALFAELLGLVFISGEVDNFGDRFTHSIDFGAQLTGHSVNPGIFYMIPLDDDFSDELDGVLGIKVDFVMP